MKLIILPVLFQMDIQNFIDNGHKTYLPHVAVDCAVFGFDRQALKVLLLKWKHIEGWSLPGGYMKRTEESDDAARRLLFERTGLSNIFLKQYHTFTGINRTKFPDELLTDLAKQWKVNIPAESWLNSRVICIGYYALVDYSKVLNPTSDGFTDTCEWKNIHHLPPLLFDHAEMIETALNTLRLQLSYQPVGLNLLPPKFTMSELQTLYETILDKEFDRGNFRKKMISTGLLKKTGERPSGKAHKTPHLYSFNKARYDESMKSGLAIKF